jgi:hypothetical protein
LLLSAALRQVPQKALYAAVARQPRRLPCRDFHGRCDGRAKTLAFIEDTAGNIFGGFTPVEWDSSGGLKADPSLKSFLFTLKNPHNFPAKKLALKAEKKHRAINCDSSMRPDFWDIGVCDGCNANTLSCAYFNGWDDSYANDTGFACLDLASFSRTPRPFHASTSLRRDPPREWMTLDRMPVPRVTSRAEDVASVKRIVEDGEEDSKISSFFYRCLTARARRIIFMGADARSARRGNSI